MRSPTFRPARRCSAPSCGGRRCGTSAICTPARAPRWRCSDWASTRRRARSPRPSSPTCRMFGAPRALGVAVRVAGLARGGRPGSSCSTNRCQPHGARPRSSSEHTRLSSSGRRCAAPASAPRRVSRSPRGSISRPAAAPARSLARAREELKATGARPRREWRTGVEALTPSELRIVRLAAEGRTNREIAHELYVTLKTVEGHLSRAYTKLGIEGRARASSRCSKKKRPGWPPSSERRLARATLRLRSTERRRLVMTITAREAFESGTDTFNAHDIDGFAEVLADDVVVSAPGGDAWRGQGGLRRVLRQLVQRVPRRACRSPRRVTSSDNVAVEDGTFSGTHDGVLHSPTGDIPPTGRPVERGLHPGAPLPRRQARLVQPDVRPAADARAARPRSRTNPYRMNQPRPGARRRCFPATSERPRLMLPYELERLGEPLPERCNVRSSAGSSP